MKMQKNPKKSLLEKLKKKMGIDVNDDKNSDNEDTSAAKRKRIYAKNNKWAEKKTRKVELAWIHEGKQVRKGRAGGTRILEGGTRILDVSKESKKADILQCARDLFFPNE